MAHKTPYYNTKMLLKVVFDKTAFIKFKICNNLNKTIDETLSKQLKLHRKIYTSLWIEKISRKKSANQSFDTFAKCLLFLKRKPVPRIWI